MITVNRLPDGGFSLSADGRPVFAGACMTLRDSAGQERRVSFTECVQEGNRLTLRAETEEFTASLSFEEGENALTAYADASWKTQGALFGGLRTFPRRGGVCLTLPGDAGFLSDRCVAIYQHKAWWLRPAFFAGASGTPDKTQLLLSRRGDVYEVLTAVAGERCRCDFSGGPEGLRAELSIGADGCDAYGDLFFSFAWGADPYACCAASVRLPLERMGRTRCLRENKQLPEMFEYFGWCSWDAFYHKVNEAGLLEKMEELREKQVPVRWALIDDGWSDAEYGEGMQRLRGFDAAPDKFPEGLGAAVRTLKSRYGLQWVGVWQAIMGYWNGLVPNSPAERETAAWLTQMADGRRVPDAEPGKAFAFWDRWHSLLERWGVDFVKVDEQSAISIFHTGRHSFGEACRSIHAALEGSGGIHFDNRVIHCMGTAPEDLWNRTGAASVSRSSDDFVPHTEHGFREHAIQNGYNSLLHGQFYWGDWDMFWSDHAEANQNSILRAVSGGPVYTSDAVGKTDPAKILPLILSDGRVLRCEGTGVPTADCLFEDPVNTRAPLKLWNSGKGFTAVAAFHISRDETAASGSLGADDVPALAGKTLWCWDWQERCACLLRPGERMEFTLEPGGARLYLLLPAEEETVFLGLVEKYLAPAAIRRVERRDGAVCVQLAEPGIFGFLSSREPSGVTADGKPASWKANGPYYELTVPAREICFLN
ncbi:MAG: hypothetical protein KH202_02170 [Clostridiales bacterium]|nr:hypothetical protein [Clostridiales bacterium]